MKSVTKIIGFVLSLISMSDGRSSLAENNGIQALDGSTASGVPADIERRYKGYTYEIIVAEAMLAALDDVISASFPQSERSDSGIVAGDCLKIGLFAFMGYHGRDNCMKRSACEAGDLLSRMSDTSTVALVGLYYMAPNKWADIMDVLQKGAGGKSCYIYRCGPPLRSETKIPLKMLV